MAEITAVLIESGMAAKFLGWHRTEAAERVRMARDILKRDDIAVETSSYHVWLPLPEPWRAMDFAAEVRALGVLVSPADYFAVDRGPVPHAIRISLGGVGSRARLADGLRAVAAALEAHPTPMRSAI
jgi:DNA-binding transcriptional MocR family regulator